MLCTLLTLEYNNNNYNINNNNNSNNIICMYIQRAKKVMSDSLGLVDFAIELVNSVFNLPDGQVIFFEQLE